MGQVGVSCPNALRRDSQVACRNEHNQNIQIGLKLSPHMVVKLGAYQQHPRYSTQKAEYVKLFVAEAIHHVVLVV